MTKTNFIPLSRPYTGAEELDNLSSCLKSEKLSGDGEYTKLCEKQLQDDCGADRVLLTTSCTAALELCAHLLDVGPDDEVILPSFTFVSTANAFVLRGAKPVFADIEPDTLNLDPADVARKITPATKIIVAVHYAGVACNMTALNQLAEQHGVNIVEDAAQGVTSRWKDRCLGTIGTLGSFSFHDTKNFTSGEGGALLVNRRALEERAEILREKGTNRQQFIMGNVDKYTWMDVGSSYIPSELNAAVLYAQLQKVRQITALRKRAHEFYDELLRPLCDRGMVEQPVIPEYAVSNYHLYAIRLADAAVRDGMMAHLNANGIGATFHYIPLHTSPMAINLGVSRDDLPVTESAAARLLRLPLYAGISEDQQLRVVRTMSEYLA